MSNYTVLEVSLVRLLVDRQIRLPVFELEQMLETSGTRRDVVAHEHHHPRALVELRVEPVVEHLTILELGVGRRVVGLNVVGDGEWAVSIDDIGVLVAEHDLCDVLTGEGEVELATSIHIDVDIADETNAVKRRKSQLDESSNHVFESLEFLLGVDGRAKHS